MTPWIEGCDLDAFVITDVDLEQPLLISGTMDAWVPAWLTLQHQCQNNCNEMKIRNCVYKNLLLKYLYLRFNGVDIINVPYFIGHFT